MKRVSLLLLLALVAGSYAIPCSAKKPKKQKTPVVVEETWTDEDRNMNYSLAHEYISHKQYEQAWDFWWKVYEHNPDWRRDVYSDGEKLFTWKIQECEKAGDAAGVEKWKQELLRMYDRRMEYLGSDQKYPTPFIMGLKGLKYQELYPNDTTGAGSYEWLAASVEGMGDNVELEVLRVFEITSYKMYKADNKRDSIYLEDHLIASSIMDNFEEDSTYKYRAQAAQIKTQLENLFIASGAATCEYLEKVFGPAIQEHAEDRQYLRSVANIYNRIGCKNDILVKLNEAQKVQQTVTKTTTQSGPMAAAAAALKSRNWGAAITNLNAALAQATSNADKATLEKNIAYAYSQQGSYSNAREHARKAYALNPSLANEMHNWIASWYAKSGIRGWYWAAYDETGNAKYRQYFPSKTDMFMDPNLPKDGTKFTVGGWINLTVTARGK